MTAGSYLRRGKGGGRGRPHLLQVSIRFLEKVKGVFLSGEPQGGRGDIPRYHLKNVFEHLPFLFLPSFNFLSFGKKKKVNLIH